MSSSTRLIAAVAACVAATAAQGQTVYECRSDSTEVPVFSDAPTGPRERSCTAILRFSRQPAVRTTAPAHLVPLIAAAADRHQLPYHLLEAVVATESAFKPAAVSRKGAMGLTQLMPATARQLGVQQAFDPAENLDGGARHLSRLLQAWQGDVALALAAYNAGEGAVIRYGNRIPPYRETIEYVRRIQARWKESSPDSAGDSFEAVAELPRAR